MKRQEIPMESLSTDTNWTEIVRERKELPDQRQKILRKLSAIDRKWHLHDRDWFEIHTNGKKLKVES